MSFCTRMEIAAACREGCLPWTCSRRKRGTTSLHRDLYPENHQEVLDAGLAAISDRRVVSAVVEGFASTAVGVDLINCAVVANLAGRRRWPCGEARTFSVWDIRVDSTWNHQNDRHVIWMCR